MTEADSPLTNARVQELLHLALRTYHDQAAMCHKAKAYLASCIMAGAVVEAVHDVEYGGFTAPDLQRHRLYLWGMRFCSKLAASSGTTVVASADVQYSADAISGTLFMPAGKVDDYEGRVYQFNADGSS